MKKVDRARELYSELMNYDSCHDDLIDEAAQLLLDLADEVEFLKQYELDRNKIDYY